MWPLDSIRAKRSRRRYEVALALFAAEATYESLDRAARTKVEGMIVRITRQVGLFPAEHRRWAPWALRNAFRAEAMQRLGIAPIGEGITWPAFVGASLMRSAVGLWAFDYRGNDPATAEASHHLLRSPARSGRNS